MVKRFLLYGLLIIFTLTIEAQTPQELIRQIKNSKADTNQVNLLLQLGSYYLYKPGEFKNDLDSAMNNFNAALQLSQKLNFKKGELKTFLLMAGCHMEADDFSRAKSYYIKVINYYHATGDKLNEALTWNEYGIKIAFNDAPHLAEREGCFKKAYDLFNQIPGKQIEVINAYKNIADVHLNEGKYSQAETELLQVKAQFEKLHYVKLYQTYYLLAVLYDSTKNFERQLFYAIECVKNMEMDPNADPSERLRYYYVLGLRYEQVGDFDQCIAFEKKALEASKRSNFKSFYPIVIQTTFALESQKKPASALSFLQMQQLIHPPETEQDKIWVAEFTLRYNFSLKHYDEVGKTVPHVIKLFLPRLQKARLTKEYGFLSDYADVLRLTTLYYLATGQNRLAEITLDSILVLPVQKLNSNELIYMLWSKVDSVKGDYAAALKHYKVATRIYDSIKFVAKNEQIARMYASFKTFQKDQSIQALNKKNSDQQARLQKDSTRQNYILGAVVMLLITASLAFIGFRNKQRTNRKLKVQQAKINRQNQSLNRLLEEKDWLLKEVHHRVKNNLQIVISLLNAQSAYLENNTALAALRESQNRVQAISLIHQKLYNNNNMTAIDMPAYVSDMVRYLSDCLDTAGRGIRFDQSIAPVKIDLAQAVPLGLILNEAITNAIKYAFGKDGGTIIINLHLTDDGTARLTIADNGKGMPEDFDLKETNSLGMEMMKALSKQLAGDFKINSKAGVTICIGFKLESAVNGIIRENVVI